MKFLRRAFCIFFACFCVALTAQNLVMNGSFEEIDTHCPAGISQLAHASPWFSPNANTPDIFCACANKKYFFAGVPGNFAGYQPPRTGTCYAGIICYYGPSQYLEFVSTRLSSPLEKEKKYCVSFYYSLSNYSAFTVSHLGLCFTKRPPRIKGNDELGKLLITSPANTDSSSWNRFEYIYTATGKEKYITIGSFGASHAVRQPQALSKRLQNLKMRPLRAAYYYIDDVCITEIKDSCRCYSSAAPALPVEEVVTEAADTLLNQVAVLENVTFETAKAELLSSSYGELDHLVAMLHANEGLKIELSGHTDNAGAESENRKLSLARAKSVAEYLRLKGIDPSRIKYKGYGSSQPVADNGIEEGRRMNRRVEFYLHY